jgi:hypothetical protein
MMFRIYKKKKKETYMLQWPEVEEGEFFNGANVLCHLKVFDGWMDPAVDVL